MVLLCYDLDEEFLPEDARVRGIDCYCVMRITVNRLFDYGSIRCGQRRRQS